MLKPSKKHFIRYDAQTYEEKGFLEVGGKVRDMSKTPRFWHISATAITQDENGVERQRKNFKFQTSDRFKLSELALIVNEKIHESEDYLPDCVSVMVVARVMTEGGV
jgi:hypothetical protein